MHPSAPQRHAVVSVEAQAAGAVFVQVARGSTRNALLDVKMFGPFAALEADKAVAGVLRALRDEGYEVAGLGLALADLSSKQPRVRAHAARRLSLRKEPRLVDVVLAQLDKPKEDVSTLVEALGRVGDPRAIPFVRAEAEKKLLSRRRAGVEALRMLNDTEGLALAHERALARLSDDVRAAAVAEDLVALTSSLSALDVKDRGLAIDTVYELNGHAHVAAARVALMATDMVAPHLWRYAKSVWKRAMVQNDSVTVGLIAHRAELRARATTGTPATLKSGYDGELRTVRVFSPATANYVRRRVWRWLATLAKSTPDLYAVAAADVLLAYADADDVVQAKSAHGKGGHASGYSYVFHRILLGASSRYRLNSTKLWYVPVAKATTAPVGAREEMFAPLWDQAPRAYLRLLAHARHAAVQTFAVSAVLSRHKDVLREATASELVSMVGSDDPRIVDIGIGELRRRFDPHKPDLRLILALCDSASDTVRGHGIIWMNESATLWMRAVDDVMLFLCARHAQSADSAARLVRAGAATLSAPFRQALATRVLAQLELVEAFEGAHVALADVAVHVVLDEVVAQMPIMRALSFVNSASDAALSVGAAVLARKSGAVDVLGLTRVVSLCNHDKVVVRSAALALLAGGIDDLKRDPSPLFSLVDSDWADVRVAAMTLLEQVDVATLGMAGLLGLADSTRVDVQSRARTLLDRALPQLDVHELLGALAQHPGRVMQAYAVDLAKHHLKPGFVRLAKLEPLFRSVLFDAGASRRVRRFVIDLLKARGQLDEAQAEVAAHILSDFVNTRTQIDRDDAVMALTQLKLAFPHVQSALSIVAQASSHRAST